MKSNPAHAHAVQHELDDTLQQLALFDTVSEPDRAAAPAPCTPPEPEPAHLARDEAKAQYHRLMRAGGYQGDALKLIGRCTTLAVQAGIRLEKHLRNLENFDRFPGAAHVFHERTSKGRRSLKPERVRGWYEDDAAKLGEPSRNGADTLTTLSELRERAASYPWPSSIEYVVVRVDRAATKESKLEAQRKNPKTDDYPRKHHALRERVAGDTARRVYLALVGQAIRTGSVTNPCAIREVAIWAQVSPATAERALRALRHLKLIAAAESNRRSTRNTASRYRINTNPSILRGHSRDNGVTALQGLSPVVPHLTATFTASTAQHPAFRSGTGLRHDVWHAVLIADGSATAPQLADQLDRNPRTVRRQVAALERAHLLERFDDGTLRARLDHAALDAAALTTGGTERAARQVDRIRNERARHEQAGMIRAAEKRGLEVRAQARTGTTIVVDRATGETQPLEDWFTAAINNNIIINNNINSHAPQAVAAGGAKIRFKARARARCTPPVVAC